jgi:hypothetical protein
MVVAVLAAAVLAVYLPVVRYGFVGFDDNRYITDNPLVRGGLSPGGVVRAFTTAEPDNWHPLTWLSHMADVEMFGLRPGAYHAVSLLIHLLAAVFLLVLLRAMTGALWLSALAAALFALHPLHVESVVWLSERKDVLAGLFWMLSTLAWIRHLRRPGPARYLEAAGLFALGLMSKAMLVTLPCVWILLDFWPLGRWRPGRPPGTRSIASLAAEKAPFFVLAAATAVVTWLVQSRSGAVITLAAYPFGRRLVNALPAYATYLEKTLWPVNLAFFYPTPPGEGWTSRVAVAALLLVVITAGAFLARRRAPWLAVGWLWYLGTLVPVIGLVQVGGQGMADRYTYLPLIGVFIMVAWGWKALTDGLPGPRIVPGLIAAAMVVLLAAQARVQVGYWRDNRTLFGHALAVTRDNWMAHLNLGKVLGDEGDTPGAIAHFAEAARLNPSFGKAWINLGVALRREGRFLEAADSFRAFVELAPGSVDGLLTLSVTLLEGGAPDRALFPATEAVALAPGRPDAHRLRGEILEALSRPAEAVVEYREAVRLDPGDDPARARLDALVPGPGAVRPD